MIVKNLPISLIIGVFLMMGVSTWAQQVAFEWPDGKKAAVCMSYDDGIASQLDHAIPDLNASGFSGTFYLTGSNLYPESIEHWREAATQGHELGCHTLFHPCSGEFDWVPEEYKAENYTIRRILDELKVMNQFLFAVDGKYKRSYAYTCYETEVGGISFIDTLSRSGMFVGARGGSNDMGHPRDMNLFDIPSLSITDELPFEQVIDYVERAMAGGSVAVFTFHGVGGDYIQTSREYHQRIIDYLKANEEDLWVAPLVEIASHLGSSRNQAK